MIVLFRYTLPFLSKMDNSYFDQLIEKNSFLEKDELSMITLLDNTPSIVSFLGD